MCCSVHDAAQDANIVRAWLYFIFGGRTDYDRRVPKPSLCGNSPAVQAGKLRSTGKQDGGNEHELQRRS